MNKDSVKKTDFSKEADILKVLGHPVRLKIVIGLIHDECCVKDIWECMDLPQPVVSQHLAILRNKGIVTARRHGNRTIYAVADATALRIARGIMDKLEERQGGE